MRIAHVMLVFLVATSWSVAQNITYDSLFRTSQRIPLRIVEGTNACHVLGFISGKTYIARAIAGEDHSDLSISFRDQLYQSHEAITFVAQASDERFTLQAAASDIGWLSVSCMDCEPSRQQQSGAQERMMGIEYDSTLTPEELVLDVLIEGGCFDVENVAYRGDARSIGLFRNGDASIGMSSGIIMSTGFASDVVGANVINAATGPVGSTPGEPDLELLAEEGPINVIDVSTLEFDFTPSGERVEFRFAFASEEYCEFINTEFNDVFGFFVSGPGLSGPFTDNGVNIATIPGNNDIISINSINSFTNQGFYIDNIPSNFIDLEFVPSCSQSVANDEPWNDLIQANGFTTVLTAGLDVTPCETYHIKLALADIGDLALDSWVFLEANSFSAGSTFEVELSQDPVDGSPVVYEGCDQSITFSKTAEDDLSDSVIIQQTISGTATLGVDYDNLPDQIIIPPGETSVSVPINVFLDNIDETGEYLEFVFPHPCRCSFDTLRVVILDNTSLSIELEDAASCDEATNIAPIISGGVGPFDYVWSNAEVTASISAEPGVTAYAVTVTDFCGFSAVDSMMISSFEEATLSLTPDEIPICAGVQSAIVELNHDQTLPVSFIIEAPDGSIDTVEDQGQMTEYQVEQVGTYTLLSGIVGGCEAQASDSIQVSEGRLTADPVIAGEPCAGDISVTVTYNAESNHPPLTYTYPDGTSNNDDVTMVTGASDFEVTISDALGCELVVPIVIPNNFEATITIDQPLCDDTLGVVDLERENRDDFNYILSPDDISGEEWPVQLPPGSYDMVVFAPDNDADCMDTVSFTIDPSTDVFVSLPTTDTVFAGDEIQLVPMVNIDPSLLTRSFWSPPSGLSSPSVLQPMASPEETTVYTLNVTDVDGCTDTAQIQVVVIPLGQIYVPNAFSPNNDGINDILYPFSGSPFIRIAQFSIFDRWGGEVMRRTDIPVNDERFGWDGSANGEALDPGVYTYYLEAIRGNGAILQLSGDVQLIR